MQVSTVMLQLPVIHFGFLQLYLQVGLKQRECAFEKIASCEININGSCAGCLETCPTTDCRPTVYSCPVYDILVLHFKSQVERWVVCFPL